MKIILSLLITLGSFSAFASGFLEVDCRARVDGAVVNMSVDEGLTPYSLKDAQLSVTSADGEMHAFNYVVSTYFFHGMNRVEYRASDVSLSVDFWPDNGPRWGRMYRGVLQGKQVSRTIQLHCRYPNVR